MWLQMQWSQSAGPMNPRIVHYMSLQCFTLCCGRAEDPQGGAAPAKLRGHQVAPQAEVQPDSSSCWTGCGEGKGGCPRLGRSQMRSWQIHSVRICTSRDPTSRNVETSLHVGGITYPWKSKHVWVQPRSCLICSSRFGCIVSLLY